jgi:choline dehydrogenase
MVAEKASDHIKGKGILPKSNFEPWINSNWEKSDR